MKNMDLLSFTNVLNNTTIAYTPQKRPQMRKLSSKYRNSVPSIEFMEPPAAVTLASAEIRKFLIDTITKRETNLIISTMRKGSWIIDDILNTSDLRIEHYTNYDLEKITPSALSGKHILVFDDSIKTGESTLSVLSKLGGLVNVCVACIAINDKALMNIKEKCSEIE
ncbi:MAG: hypothetical protein FWD92_00805 [Methanomassiliicoccaceae archaeon]|nr:hypothetical protein [Methanomassiliicoccaceae archaeon]